MVWGCFQGRGPLVLVVMLILQHTFETIVCIQLCGNRSGKAFSCSNAPLHKVTWFDEFGVEDLEFEPA